MEVPTQDATHLRAAHTRQPSARMARAHTYVARAMLVGVFGQVFLAGLGVFTHVGFLPHSVFGTMLVAASFSLPIIAGFGRLGQRLSMRSWLLAGLMVMQGLLIDVGRLGLVYVAALHPVNALLIVLVTLNLAGVQAVTSVFARRGGASAGRPRSMGGGA